MRCLSLRQFCGATLLLLHGQVALSALDIQINNEDSIKKAGEAISAPMIDFYKANLTEGIPGKLTGTWYVAGSMFMTWIQFWSASGDDTYNSLVSHDLMFQAGDRYDFFPSNWSQWLGNDDQMFWGLAAITASETGFPEIDGKPSWASTARAVFDMQAGRWDSATCHGGMRWQIWPYQAGYQMKNSISNGGLFELAARLARFTKNETYVEWAEQIWDWSADSPLMNNKTWYIADSTSNVNNCKDSGNIQWTYNYGTYLAGAAYLYNHTNGDEKWLTRVNGLLESTFATFFPKEYGGNILSEAACEPLMTCDRNQLGFKGYVSMWLAFTAILVPSTADRIRPKLQGTVEAVAKQCSGGSKNLCGSRWYQPTWDGIQGLEVQMAALGIVTANLMMLKDTGPKTIDTNPNGGASAIDTGEGQDPRKPKKITTADKAGAWILTVLLMVAIGGGAGWLMKTEG